MDLNDLTPEQVEILRRSTEARYAARKLRTRKLMLQEIRKGDVIRIPAEPGLHHSSRIARDRRITRQDDKALVAFIAWKGLPPDGLADILREDEEGFLIVLHAARRWMDLRSRQEKVGRNVVRFEARSAGTGRYTLRKGRIAA